MDFQSEKSFGKLRLRAFQPIPSKFYVCQSMSKMLKIDQIHLRAVMLCYVCRRCRRCIALNALNTVQKIKVMSKMSKIDQNTPKGCNAKYVEDVEECHTNVYELQCRF